MEDLLIRPAVPADLDRLKAIEDAGFPPEEAATRAALEYRIAAFPQWFLVGERAGTPVGFVNGPATRKQFIQDDLFAPGGYDPDGKTLAILGVAVDPAFRRQGIAGQILRSYLDAARTGGMERVVLTCKERMLPYYARFGFVNRGISQSVHGGVVWYDMECAL